MPPYMMPQISSPTAYQSDEIALVASGDLRESANRVCWPAQAEMERKLAEAFAAAGYRLRRAHAYDPARGHGFISSQRMGMDVFQNIPKNAPVIVAEAVWQYSYHVLAGLRDHQGPILTVANWSGEWPGLVGLLNLNGSLTKMGVDYSTIWSVDFEDDFFLNGIHQWLREGFISHDTSHVRALDPDSLPEAEAQLGQALARKLSAQKAIIGVFDEGCMGMYNAIIEDELLNPAGIYKERLSQSALVAAMRTVSDFEANDIRAWLEDKGVRFVTGPDPAQHLTEAQIHEQCCMYVAVVRMAAEFGCDAVGIQYQQGLKDMTPASDLVEGLLNNVDRPPVMAEDGKELYARRPLPHFNEADEGQAVDALVTNWVWTAMGFDPANTLHDVRWGEHYQGAGLDDFIWTLMISGAAPASHLAGGYAGAISYRQPPMYFQLGGGTLSGVGKLGEIVWSRVYVAEGGLHADLGRGRGVPLPEGEVQRRLQATTPQWPILNAIFDGVSRDQFMAQHKSNHVCIAYAPSADGADKALMAKAAMFAEMGLKVHLCGV